MCPVCKFRGWLQRCLKSNKPVRVKAITDKKDRERVIAEITLSHLIRLGNEQGSCEPAAGPCISQSGGSRV
jgi:hypothetical protein